MPFRFNPFINNLDVVDITSIPPGVVDSISGNSGGAVGPDGSNDITFTASGGFTVIGTPGTFSLNLAPSGWTAGSVIYASSATAFTQDNANFFYDSGTSSLLLGTTTAVASSILTLNSTTKGFRPPSMTTVQKNAIVAPATGLLLYDNTLNDIQYYNGASWVSSAGVTSVTGTSNQITASPTTGAVVVSLTNGISVGSYQAISPPTGGLLIPGQVSIGTSSFSSPAGVLISLTNAAQLATSATLTAKTTIVTAADQAGIWVNTIFNPTSGSAGLISGIANLASFVAPGGSTISSAACYTAAYTAASNAGTITNLIGYYSNGGLGVAGTVTNSYSAYFSNPSGASVNVALYTANASIGYLATSPPSDGLIVSGKTSIGVNAPYSTGGAVTRLTLQKSSTDNIGVVLLGTSNAVQSDLTQYGMIIGSVFNPTNGSSVSGGMYFQPFFISPAAQTIAVAASIISTPFFSSNVGTITDGYSILVDSSSGAGTITRMTNLLVKMPTAGSTNICAAFQGGISVGSSYSTTAAPTDGMIVLGRTGIGTNSPASTVKLQVGATGDTTANAIRIANANSANANPVLSMFSSGATELVMALENGFLLFAANPASYSTANLQSAGKIAMGPSGGLCVGSSYINTSPPSDGIIVQGGVAIGSSSLTSNVRLQVTAATTDFDAVLINGTLNAVSSTNQFALRINPTLQPTSGAAGVVEGINLTPTIVSPNAQTISTAVGMEINPIFSSNVGTITVGYSLFVGSTGAAGTVTTMYGLYVATPSVGTTKICAYFQSPVQFGTNTTGAATATLGTNCPGGTTPATWITVLDSGGTTRYIPAF